jgi:MoaA/NifB/PqqE/SkfB family radical SAM enzyme
MSEAMPSSEGAVEPRAFRLDVPLHNLLVNAPARPAAVPNLEPQTLPEPVFPQYPGLLKDRDVDLDDTRPHIPPRKRRWPARHLYRYMEGWLFPYIRSRVLPGDFHPIIAYLFTEWKCNLDCHYCWAFDNSVKGMTEDVARRAIDWLHANGCRVLALMGGEPLLRPQFVHKIVYYAAKKGFWVYIPTNARLLRQDVIDRLLDAGTATINFAVDVVDEKPGLAKALAPVRPYFNYLVKRQYRYGTTVFFNMNICRNNHEDIKQLTEIARANGIATDYHLNESPMLHQPHFQHIEDNPTFIAPEDFPAVDTLIDWIIGKNHAGYKMVDSVERLEQMKRFLREKLDPWQCRAGHNNVVVRVDGTLAPCFPMYSATYDWGAVGEHKFEAGQLQEMKRSCEPHCLSTLNSNLAFCYNDARVIRWVLKQAKGGFQGVSGSFS